MKKTRSRESRDTVPLSTLNRFSDPRLFVMNLNPQTVPLDSKFFCFFVFTYRYCGKYGTFTLVFKKITTQEVIKMSQKC
jgi:hypothetical protein